MFFLYTGTLSLKIIGTVLKCYQSCLLTFGQHVHFNITRVILENGQDSWTDCILCHAFDPPIDQVCTT